jgi:hypothetical protein
LETTELRGAYNPKSFERARCGACPTKRMRNKQAYRSLATNPFSTGRPAELTPDGDLDTAVRATLYGKSGAWSANLNCDLTVGVGCRSTYVPPQKRVIKGGSVSSA